MSHLLQDYQSTMLYQADVIEFEDKRLAEYRNEVKINNNKIESYKKVFGPMNLTSKWERCNCINLSSIDNKGICNIMVYKTTEHLGCKHDQIVIIETLAPYIYKRLDLIPAIIDLYNLESSKYKKYDNTIIMHYKIYYVFMLMYYSNHL